MGEGGGVGPAHGREPQRNKKTLTILAAGRNGDPDGHGSAHPLTRVPSYVFLFFFSSLSLSLFLLVYCWASPGRFWLALGRGSA